MLQKICSLRMILPTTYKVSGELSFDATQPVAFGGFCDVHKGYLGAADVCIKRLRISATGDREMVKKVYHPHDPRLHYNSLTSYGGTLQGGSGVEASQPPEYCALQRCHLRIPPTRVRMDAWWRVERIYQV